MSRRNREEEESASFGPTDEDLDDYDERYSILQFLAETIWAIRDRFNVHDADTARTNRHLRIDRTELLQLLGQVSEGQFEQDEHQVRAVNPRNNTAAIGSEPWAPLLPVLNTAFPRFPRWLKQLAQRDYDPFRLKTITRSRCESRVYETASDVVASLLAEVTPIEDTRDFRRSLQNWVGSFFVYCTVKQLVDQVAPRGSSRYDLNKKFALPENTFSFASSASTSEAVVTRWNKCNSNSVVLDAHTAGFEPIKTADQGDYDDNYFHDNNNMYEVDEYGEDEDDGYYGSHEENHRRNNTDHNNSFFHDDVVTVLTGPSGVGKTSAALVMARDGTNTRAGVCFYATAHDLFNQKVDPVFHNKQHRDRCLVAALLLVMFKNCLGWNVDRSELKQFEDSNKDVEKLTIVDLFKRSCTSSVRFAPFNGNVYIVLDEIGIFPTVLRGCCAIVQQFNAAVKQIFNLHNDSKVYLIAVGTGAENFQLNRDLGSMPESYHIRSIRAQLLHPLLKSYILQHKFNTIISRNDRNNENFIAASFFVGLFNMLFPNSASTVDVTNIVTYRIRQLASNSRCAALLVDVIAKLVDSPRLGFSNTRRSQQHQVPNSPATDDGFLNASSSSNSSCEDTCGDDVIAFKWSEYDEGRIRGALPLLLSNVATRFASLNGLEKVTNKRRVILRALGFSLNRDESLGIDLWQQYATRYGLITDNARWITNDDLEFLGPDEALYTHVRDEDGDLTVLDIGSINYYYCYPSNQPRYQIQEAETSLLLAWLGATDSEMGFASNSTRGWFLFEQLVLDYHSLRTVVPASPSVAWAFNQLLESQKQRIHVQTKTENQKTKKFMVEPTFASPHILFSADPSHRVEGIYRVHSDLQIQDTNYHHFAFMDMSSHAQRRMNQNTKNIITIRNKNNSKQTRKDSYTLEIDFNTEDTWRSAVCNNYAVVIHNADRASGADGIILTKGRVSLVQCKQYESKVLTSDKAAEEFRKMHTDNPNILSLLRRCCRVNDGDDEDSVQVICTIVVSNKEYVQLNKISCPTDDGKVTKLALYEATNVFEHKNNLYDRHNNIFEFFVCERGDVNSPFPFFPFAESNIQNQSTPSTSRTLKKNRLFLINQGMKREVNN